VALSVAERSRRYREAHPERAKASGAAWCQRNPDKVREKARRRRAAGRVKKLSPEKKALKAKRYAAKHSEHLKAYHKRYQAENRERLVKQRQEYWVTRGKARVRPLVIERRAWINSMKEAPCMDCGGRFPPCAMDFDHANGDKAATVSQMMFAPEADVLREIQKCELVCANCHRVRTFTRKRAQLESVAS
jgi:hypothetical protein